MLQVVGAELHLLEPILMRTLIALLCVMALSGCASTRLSVRACRKQMKVLLTVSYARQA